MPDYFIQGTKQATVPVQFMVSAEDESEAMRQVYSGKVEPMIVGQPSLSWDTRITETPKRIAGT